MTIAELKEKVVDDLEDEKVLFIMALQHYHMDIEFLHWINRTSYSLISAYKEIMKIRQEEQSTE